MSIRIGEAAPAFSLPDADGNTVTLEDFRGKHVILYFYPEDDTSNGILLQRFAVVQTAKPGPESLHQQGGTLSGSSEGE